ncbi:MULTISPECIES: NIL domain-containing protein [Bacillus]
MAVIREICNKVAVMENGLVVEQGSVLDVFSNPQTETARKFVRTVIHDEVPQSFLNTLKDEQPIIWKINFVGATSGKPLLSTIAKKFDVDLNVLSANISEVQETPFGNLIIEVTGDKQEIEKAFQYIEAQEIMIQEVKVNG